MEYENRLSDLSFFTGICQDTLRRLWNAGQARSFPIGHHEYIPQLSTILEVIKHTELEYTFRMEYTGDVKPGQFFELSLPKYGEAPSLSPASARTPWTLPSAGWAKSPNTSPI